MSDLESQDSINLEGTIHPVDFRGTTNEYFGIWIVNVLLSILTLGIFSAWAKVRNKKFFYGNTFIDDNNFDYHATGPQILIGRLIVFGVYLLFVASQFIHIGLYIAMALLLFGALGWLIAKALRFNSRMSSYRNVRFDFVGKGMDGWLRYVLFPIMIYIGLIAFLLSLIGIPFLSRSINRWIVNNSKYGDRPFSFDAEISDYFKPFLLMMGIILLSVIVGLGLMFLSVGGLSGLEKMADPATVVSPAMSMIPILIYLFMFLVIFPASMIYSVAIRNIIFNNTVLDDKHHFISTVQTLPYAWIIISNAFAALFTFGLMIPWGRVRLARYMAANTSFVSGGGLDDYSSSVIETSGVSAAEYADFEGFDIDLGI